MSLPTSDLEFISSKVSDGFTGLQIAAVIGEFCSVYGLAADYRPQGRTESKAKFVHRAFRMFDTEFQIALARYFVEKSPKLKEDRIVQQLLARLARDYGEVSLSEEELQRRSELELLLTPYQDVLGVWQKVESFRASYQYQDCLNNARLSLEILLQKLLNNSKSLENQREIFCQKLASAGLPNELVNVIWKSIDDDRIFQNNQIKHGILSDDISELEVDFIINRILILMSYLVKKIGDDRNVPII